MHIVVLVKRCPWSATERLLDGQRGRPRSGLEVNGNDEYVLERGPQADRGARRRGDAADDGAGRRVRSAAQGPGDGGRAGRPRHGRRPRRAPARGRPRVVLGGGPADADVRPRVRGRRHLRRRGRRGWRRDRRAARPAVPLVRRPHRARRRRRRPRPPPLTAPATTCSRPPARRGRWAPRCSANRGTRRCGDHGGALEGDRHLVAGRSRHRPRASAAAAATTRVVGSRPPPPRARRRSCAHRPTPPWRRRRLPRRPRAHLMAGDLGRRRASQAVLRPGSALEVATLARGSGSAGGGRRASCAATIRPRRGRGRPLRPEVLAMAGPGDRTARRPRGAAQLLPSPSGRPAQDLVLLGAARTAGTSPGCWSASRAGGPRQRDRG